MLPLVEITNRVWNGAISRIDYIIQMQVVILLSTRIVTTLFYLALLVKYSYVHRRNLVVVLVENFSLEVTDNISLDITVALTLITTYWTYQDTILAMIVRQCVCYIIALGLCVLCVLNSFRISIRLAYAAIYHAAVVLLTGAPTHQSPALAWQRSADPFILYPTLVAPMVTYVYRGWTSPLGSLFVSQADSWTPRASTHGSDAPTDRNQPFRALSMSGYVQIDGSVMRPSSVFRCFAAFMVGSFIDTSGPIHYLKLTDDQTIVQTRI
ncbi:unnamed protein product [Aphanomyces euteiches]|uniref:Uncharacterized protein n=1 Tax=Aphanomyces euteiches TaxID=100861 RepID=A0A6G0XH81_9STRA|nr:hypothetical protein Ae201684_004807 [Aphanomyces euteiches]KAH9073169.1 hypothetical protein Ae201684P_014986 [Aphanomyces euteiches]